MKQLLRHFWKHCRPHITHRCLWFPKETAKTSKEKTETHKCIVGLAKPFLLNRGTVGQDQTQHQEICLRWHSCRAMHKNCWQNWDRPWEHKCDFVWEEAEQGAVLPSGLRYNASVCFDIGCANPPAEWTSDSCLGPTDSDCNLQVNSGPKLANNGS